MTEQELELVAREFYYCKTGINMPDRPPLDECEEDILVRHKDRAFERLQSHAAIMGHTITREREASSAPAPTPSTDILSA